MLLPLCVACFVVFFVHYNRKYFANPKIMVQFFYNFYAFLGVITALALGARFFNRQTPFNLFCKKYSFGVFVFHCTFLIIANYFMLKLNFSLVLCYCVGFVFSLAASLLFSIIVSKIPFLRYILLGQKGKLNGKNE